MCFPSKRQKNNFVDEVTPSSNGSHTEKKVSEPAPQINTLLPVTMSSPKIAIIIYSMYGHIAKMAEATKEGIEKAGGQATIFQIPETLSAEILAKMYAPAKPDYPIINPNDLVNYDGYLFGVPTRYGNMPAQWKTFLDATGGLWASSALTGKFAGVFVSTGSLGGGQELTVLSLLSTFSHHGIIFVPLGYKAAYSELTNIEEAHGGSPWGAGTLAGGTGARNPSKVELDMARGQGKSFYETLARVKF